MAQIPIPQQAPIERAGWNTDFTGNVQLPNNERTPVNPIDIANQQAMQQSQMGLQRAQTMNAAQDVQQKQRNFQLSMLNGVMSLPPEKQQDALNNIIPMMNRMGPTQYDIKTPDQARLIMMANVPTEQVPQYNMMQSQAGLLNALRDKLAPQGMQGVQSPIMQPQGNTPIPQGTPMPANGIIGGTAPIPSGGGTSIDPATLDLMAVVKPDTANAMANIQKLQYESPQGKEAIAQGESQGKLNTENAQGAKVSAETLGSLNQNLDALSKLNADLPTPSLVPVGAKAEFNKRNPFSDDKSASNAYEQFQEINQQQILSGLSDLVKSGQIRGNQFVEKMLARGYAINPDATPEARQAEIDNLRAELGNITTRTQNIAGGKQPYKPIPVTTNQKPQQVQGNIAPEGTIIHNGQDTMVKKGGQWVKM